MKLTQLKTLVKKGESHFLEFKNSTSSITSGMQTVCAFLNSKEGGIVIFGVKDDGQIVGQQISDKTYKDIAIELNKIEPHAKIEVKYVSLGNNKHAIVLIAKAGEDIPYTYDGRAFTRNQSTTRRMAKEEYIYLHNQNNPTLWESITNNTCKLKDLNRNRIKEIIRMAASEKRLPESAMTESIPNILEKLGLTVNGKPTNAVVILFCKNEFKQFMQSNIKLARFKGTDKGEFLDSKMFRGDAFDLYDKAMDFLAFYLPVSARIEPGNPNRVESPAIPYKVLREAITNALVHRDYSHSGGSLAIAIYDDRINISNSGSLPSGILLSQLSKEHPSIPRNPLIAHLFYLCGKIEKWGRGTIDMIQECRKADNPLPIYAEIGGNFSVTLPFKEPAHKITVEQTQQLDLTPLTERQKIILNILKMGSLNRQQLMTKMGTSLTARTVQLELAKLKNIGLIKSIGKAKATIWSLVDESRNNHETIAK